MKKMFLGIMTAFFLSFAWPQTVPAAQAAGNVFIKRIIVSGFVLNDKKPIREIVKSNQNKRLSGDQIQEILDDIKVLYLEAGYGSLVNITSSVRKNNLVIHVALQR